jgi:hypothetical protein
LLLSVLFTVGWQVSSGAASAATEPTVPVTTAPAPDDTPEATAAPEVTCNEFLPEDRSISECISAAPRPGCGSKQRGGWHQYLVFLSLVGGLTVIGWRIIAGVRRAPTP